MCESVGRKLGHTIKGAIVSEALKLFFQLSQNLTSVDVRVTYKLPWLTFDLFKHFVNQFVVYKNIY